MACQEIVNGVVTVMARTEGHLKLAAHQTTTHTDRKHQNTKQAMSEFTMPTGKPTQRPTGRPNQGLPFVQINKAREVYAATARARQPPTTTTTTTTAPRYSEATEPPVDTMGQPLPLPQTQTHAVQVPAKNHAAAECRNPQCAHCGRVIIPSPVASFPAIETPSISVGDWEVYTSKQPILASDEIDAETDRLGIPLPEMIFGHNRVEIKNKEKNFAISFNTPDALSLVDTTGENLLQVSYSEEWFSTRKTNGDDVKGIVKPFDWTYSTTYRGSLPQDTPLTESHEPIPLDKLKRPDPILFFDDLVLFEDELGDNGISVLSCKIRVMPERLLLLSRFFLRVDNVLFRVRDTRVYVDFTENLVIREYKEQEATHEEVMKKISPLAGDPRAFLRDQNWIAQKLPVKKVTIDSVRL